MNGFDLFFSSEHLNRLQDNEGALKNCHQNEGVFLIGWWELIAWPADGILRMSSKSFNGPCHNPSHQHFFVKMSNIKYNVNMAVCNVSVGHNSNNLFI